MSIHKSAWTQKSGCTQTVALIMKKTPYRLDVSQRRIQTMDIFANYLPNKYLRPYYEYVHIYYSIVFV